MIVLTRSLVYLPIKEGAVNIAMMKSHTLFIVGFILLLFGFHQTAKAESSCPSLAEFASQHVSIKGNLDTQINFTSQEFPFMKEPKIFSASNKKEEAIVSLTSKPETCLKGVELLNQSLADPAVFVNPTAIPTCFPFGPPSLSLDHVDFLGILASLVSTVNAEQLQQFRNVYEQVVGQVMKRSGQTATVEQTLPFLFFAFHTMGPRLFVEHINILKKYPHLELFAADTLDDNQRKMLAGFADALLPVEVGTLLEKLIQLASTNFSFQMAFLHYHFVFTLSHHLAPMVLMMSDPSGPNAGEKEMLIKELALQKGPLEELIKKSPQVHFLAYIDLAVIESFLTKPEKGFEVIDQGLKIFPDDPTLLNWAVVLRLIDLQKNKASVAVSSAALYYKQIADILGSRLTKLDANFKLLLAKAYLSNGESKKARDVLLSINEKERNTYAWLGLALTSLNDSKKDQAQKEAETALSKAKNQAEKDDAQALSQALADYQAKCVSK